MGKVYSERLQLLINSTNKINIKTASVSTIRKILPSTCDIGNDRVLKIFGLCNKQQTILLTNFLFKSKFQFAFAYSKIENIKIVIIKTSLYSLITVTCDLALAAPIVFVAFIS